jgi:hypothetical protein
MPAKRKPTFAEIVDQVLATPPTPIVVRAGGFNTSGQFFAPSGEQVVLKKTSVSPSEAAELVAAGALVVFEGCGCGGSAGGCTPEWLDTEQVARIRVAGKPEFIRGYGSPTWIDYWIGESETVVFLHGDVKWGDEL